MGSLYFERRWRWMGLKHRQLVVNKENNDFLKVLLFLSTCLPFPPRSLGIPISCERTDDLPVSFVSLYKLVFTFVVYLRCTAASFFLSLCSSVRPSSRMWPKWMAEKRNYFLNIHFLPNQYFILFGSTQRSAQTQTPFCPAAAGSQVI